MKRLAKRGSWRMEGVYWRAERQMPDADRADQRGRACHPERSEGSHPSNGRDSSLSLGMTNPDPRLSARSASSFSPAPRRPRKRKPPREQAHSAHGCDRAEDAFTGEREHVEAAGEEHHTNNEQPPAKACRTAGPLAAYPRDRKQRKRMNEVIAHSGFEHRQRIGRKA